MTGSVDIQELLPHRYPMLLVDHVLALVPGERVLAIKVITHSEPCFSGIDPARANYPLSLVVESWAQTAALLAAVCIPGRDAPTRQVLLAGSVTGVEFRGPVRPGDVLTHQARLCRVAPDAGVFEGESLVGTRVVLRVTQMVVARRAVGHLRAPVEPCRGEEATLR